MPELEIPIFVLGLSLHMTQQHAKVAIDNGISIYTLLLFIHF